jgi:hypothetical protein
MTTKIDRPDPLRHLRRTVNRIRDGVHEKRCARCFQWFPATPEHFHLKGARPCRDGGDTIRLHSTCKPCANAESREYQRQRYVPRVRQQKAEPAPRFDAKALGEVWK